MAGGSRITISDQGITILTDGKIQYQAGQHKFENGAKVDVNRTFLPDIRAKTQHRNFQAINAENNEFLKDIPYSILNKRTGVKVFGITDDKGMTKTIKSAEKDELEVKWFDQDDIAHEN